jgi:hypothetical protein
MSDDQAARIDHLLTAGLDEYFAGRYDRAVQVWSRVFFLDRTNARARAYIERARSAVAEKQRLTEAATAAAAEARVAAGAGALAPAAERDALLVVSGALASRLAPPVAVPMDSAAPAAATRRARIAHGLLVAAAGVLLFVAGYTVAARDRLAEWMAGIEARRPTAVETTLPSDAALREARQALAARRYDDARRALARVPAGDPARVDADALLAELQRAWPVVSPMLAPDRPASPVQSAPGQAAPASGAQGVGAP